MTFIPNYLCECGCGEYTDIASRTDSHKGWIKGKPKRYLYLHKLPPSFKGKKRSLEDRLKKSIAAKKRVAEGRHNSYKGGISSQSVVLRNSFEYKNWRKEVFRRDGWKCVLCGAKSGWHKETHSRIYIHADHIKPKARFPELVFELNNGRTLCAECHMKTDTYGGRTTFYGR